MSRRSRSPKKGSDLETLRARASRMLHERAIPDRLVSPADTEALSHELEVHQLELEMQNEDLRQSQLELSQARDRFVDLYEFAPIGYVTLDASGRIVEANLATASLMGYERRRLLGRSFRRFLEPDSREAFERHRRDAWASEIRHSGRVTLRRSDGTLIVLRLESVRIKGATPAGQLQTALIDITEAEEAKQALELSESRHRAIVENAPDVILTIDRRGTILATNRPGPGVNVGDNVFTEIPPDLREHCRQTLATMFETRQPFGHEIPLADHDGSQHWVNARLAPIIDNGRVAAAVVIATDVTDQVVGQRALKASEERLRAVVNTAADAIITIHRDGTIDSFNPVAERMFGYSADEVIGQNVKMLMPLPYSDEHDQYIRRFLTTGQARMIGLGREVVGKRKDGSVFPIDLAVSEIEPLQLFTGILRDISERRRLEREVLEIAAAEQHRIGRDLHDETGQKLTGTALLADTLERTLREEKSPETSLAGKVANGVKEALDQVRTLARGLIPVTVDADGLTAALDNLAREVSDLHHVRCDFNCKPMVRIANNEIATHLFRIAQEAMTNALRHSKATRIKIRLVKQRKALLFEVSDNGTGFRETQTPFNGAGLRIMRYRTGIIGGRLTIEPATMGGTRVACLLPYAD